MATPRHRRYVTPLRYEACSQNTATKSRSTAAKSRTDYEATFYYCYKSRTATKPFYYCGQNSYCHYDAQNRRNRRQFYDGFDCH
jgi:hypothetical protein